MLPADAHLWQYLENKIRDVMKRFNYREIRTPVFEYTDLFTRGIGEATDVVGKEMYTFTDKGGESITLRPEMTASVMRAYIQHNLGGLQGINKLYYIGPMFRQERPQKGRLRQFHQFGCESLGSSSPEADVETMLVALTVYSQLGLHQLNFIVNSVGCPACRPAYRNELISFLSPVRDRLSPESRKRLDINPMRILDSKNETDIELTVNAPLIHDHLCSDCAAHFSKVKFLLDALTINYRVDGRLVRGLDYYTRTAYEIQSADLGSQNALGGGGRYDLLCTDLGGKDTPAVGFAAGMERLLIVMDSLKLPVPPEETPTVYFIALGEKAMAALHVRMTELRRKGAACDMDYLNRSLKAQMREANKLGVPRVVIAGEQELEQGTCVVKNMSTGDQETVPLDKLTDFLLSIR